MLFRIFQILMLLLVLTACDKTDVNTTSEKLQVQSAQPQLTSDVEPKKPTVGKQVAPTQTFKTIEWTDLIPKADLDVLLNPPSYVTDIEDGSADDQIGNEIRMTVIPPKDDPYQQALVSKRIIPEMDGQLIRLPGFIVPLEFDDAQSITQFFLVPFFGACIHLPPPPPNQIIFVSYPKGFRVDDIYNPIWVSGTLKTSLVENETATAAYTMEMQSFEIYTE